MIPAPQIDCLIDSGAYSAWRLGAPINLDEYCAFLLKNQEWIWNYVSLDVINPADREAAAIQGRANYLHMRSLGLRPIPVFHVGERLDWLKRMLDDGADYVGLAAGSLPNRNKEADGWYSMVFDYLVNSGGLPTVKTHAFGEARESSLRQFPWYSADSASWIYAAQRTGVIQLEGGERLSCRNDGTGSESAPAIAALEGLDRDRMEELLAAHGLAPDAFDDGGAKAFIASTYCAALYYVGIQERVSALYPIKHRPKGLFCPPPRAVPPLDIPGLRLFLVSGVNVACFAALAKAEHRNVLSSYFHIKGTRKTERPDNSGLREFCMDPKATAANHPKIKRYTDLLNQVLKG
jgi:hypothetical protein